MRLYHFMCECHGLSSIKQRRLKISTIDQLNDPFEALSIALSNKSLRSEWQKAKSRFSTEYGLLCFSATWSSALMWSHYADRHRGICLGFDLPGDDLIRVDYKAKRMINSEDELVLRGPISRETIEKCLSIKYKSWHYEKEIRRIEPLRDAVKDKQGKYFSPFGVNLRLAEIIIGPLLQGYRSRITDALGELARSVQIINARLAFRSFRVVRQRNKKLWS
jgi:Protein of unknown function (DUF2971)